MQEVDTREMVDFGRTLSNLLGELPEMRRELHEELAELAKKEVDAAISSSGLNDSSGDIRRWQAAHVGSGGGTGPNSAGAITNDLEGGHKIRPPSGKPGYRPRIRMAYVNGYHFYQTARSSLEAKAIRLAEQFVEKFAKKLEGEE